MPTYVHRLHRLFNELCADIEKHVPPDVARTHRQRAAQILREVTQPFRDNPALQEEETPVEPEPHTTPHTPAPITSARQVTH